MPAVAASDPGGADGADGAHRAGVEGRQDPDETRFDLPPVREDYAARHGLAAPVMDLVTGHRNRTPIGQLVPTNTTPTT